MADATDQAASPESNPSAVRDPYAPNGKGERKALSIKALLKPLASLRLTVVLLSLGMLLVFFGSLAQIDLGIWHVVKTYFRSFYVSVPIYIFFPRDMKIPELLNLFGDRYIPFAFPFPGGWTIGSCLLLNLLAAHTLRFKLSWRRSGVLILHAGVIVLLVSELLTGILAVEGNMHIDEGASSNYAVDHREAEFAVIDTSDPKKDRVVVVPQSILQSGSLISHEKLPFDLKVDQYMVNSKFQRMLKEKKTTLGYGRFRSAEELFEVSGVDTQQRVDIPSAYITLMKKGSDTLIGTAVATVNLELPQVVTVDGKEYQFFLRFRRSYKPYTLHLIDFKHEHFPGTRKPKNFESVVQFVDPSHGVDERVHIWMNHPKRYAGETIYQSAFKPDDSGTILQVVRNPAWQLPYYSCVIISIGLLIHFSIMLSKFLKTQTRMAPVTSLSLRGRLVPWGILLLGVVVLLNAARSKPDEDGAMKVREAGDIALLYNGRVQPLDSLARNSMKLISHGETYEDKNNVEQPAIRWLLDVMFSKQGAVDEKIIRLENKPLLGLLGLKPRPHLRYSINEILSKKGLKEIDKWTAESARRVGEAALKKSMLAKLKEQDEITPEVAEEIAALEEEIQSAKSPEDELVQAGINSLSHKVGLYRMLREAASFPLPQEMKSQRDLFSWVRNQVLWQQDIENPPPAKMGEPQRMGRSVPRLLPMDIEKIEWGTPAQAIQEGKASPTAEGLEGAFGHLLRLSLAYRDNERAEFNQELKKYQQVFQDEAPDIYHRTQLEVFLNQFQPFKQCIALNIIAFLLVAIGWAGWRRQMFRSALGLICLSFVVHTVGLLIRMYLEGRPPVTNLYSSAVFVGWACVLIGIVVEVMLRNSLGSVLASVAGFLSLLVAYNLSFDGDTLEMLQAVLDTNFWLATHVVAISIGYSTTFAAGIVGIVFLVLGIFTPIMDKPLFKKLGQLNYGILCFALFFSFVGTLLGGIWGDQSWGRFWGWDTKENGALIICLWNAIILHARWAGIVRQRGVAVMAIFGNVVTSWSWFGVNMLGVGLHTYGFMDSAVFWLLLFVGSQLALIALGWFYPIEAWRSYDAMTQQPTKPRSPKVAKVKRK